MGVRWRVEHGTDVGWRVRKVGEIMPVAVFAEWREAVDYARRRAIFDGLGVVGIEVPG